MRIVVFGAGGCVGGWICEELSRRAEIEQVGCVHRWASAVRLARRGIEVRKIGLEDVEDLPGILTGADVVVNAAMPPAAREAELVTGLYAAASKAGAGRFIQFSSAAVYGNRTGEVDESAALTPVGAYSCGKAEMERRLTQAAAASPGTRVFILRPSIIYGPFSEGWTVRYVSRIVRGRWRTLGPIGEGTCNLIHARDVARAVIAAATAEVAPGVHVLNLNGEERVSWNDYIEQLGEALGIRDRVTPNPWVFRAMAMAANVMRTGGSLQFVRSLYRRSAGAAKAAMMNAQAVTNLYPGKIELELLGRKVHYSAARARQVLCLPPSVPLQEGLSQSATWCRRHGVVGV